MLMDLIVVQQLMKHEVVFGEWNHRVSAMQFGFRACVFFKLEECSC
jgi:hypothetical protein